MQYLPPSSITNSVLSKLVKRMKEKTEEADLKFSDSHLYENEVEHGRKELFTPKQKKEIIEIVTSSYNNRKKESWQVIQDNDFKDIIPDLSILLFEIIMYEAGYSVRKPR
jgi:hypothetical protein